MPDIEVATLDHQKQCFVVMGFGIKTDLATGRKLNLDKSYQALIKPVIENKGIACLRADEIKHSGTIDVPMFQQLLNADVVIADLSTANVNAFYELGIRHALRPRTTIIMSEDQLSYPFDVNHIMINKYTHLGDNIDYFEVLRFQKVLGDILDTVLNTKEPDSPVYTFLEDLNPPAIKEKAQKAANELGEALAKATPDSNKAATQNEQENPSLSIVVKQAEDALNNKQYELAKGLFNSAILLANCNIAGQKNNFNNSYLFHRLALATYKAETPDEITALHDAIAILAKLDLDHTNDPETVVLAGAIEKRLFEQGQGENHLDNAILYFQRGTFLIHNRYNVINLAFLLNCRAGSSLDAAKEEQIADIVWANRMRKDVLQLCQKDWDNLTQRANQASASEGIIGNEAITSDQIANMNEQKFWILVNKAEAHFGLGEMDDYQKAVAAAQAVEHTDAMMQSFSHQLEKLKELLEKQRQLLS